MPLLCSFDTEHRIVTSVLSGHVNQEALREETCQAILLAKENNCNTFLSDYTQAIFDFSAMDVQRLPEIQEHHGLRKPARIAILAPEDKRELELTGFYETVSVNRGWDCRIFKSRHEAIKWLTGLGAGSDAAF